jgi:hypothetical protein
MTLVVPQNAQSESWALAPAGIHQPWFRSRKARPFFRDGVTGGVCPISAVSSFRYAFPWNCCKSPSRSVRKVLYIALTSRVLKQVARQLSLRTPANEHAKKERPVLGPRTTYSVIENALLRTTVPKYGRVSPALQCILPGCALVLLDTARLPSRETLTEISYAQPIAFVHRAARSVRSRFGPDVHGDS